MRWRDVVGEAAVVGVFVVAVVVTIAQPWCGRDRSTPDEVKAVVARHIDLAQRGDLVLVHPPWRDDVVDAIAPLLPNHRVTEAFTRLSTEAWPAMLVIAEGVHPWPQSIEDRRIAVGAAIVDDDGVRFFRLPAGKGTASDSADATTPPTPSKLAIDLSRARVSVVDADGDTFACRWNPQQRRHVCSELPAWMHVGEEDLVIAGRKQRCVWAHPTSNGRLTIELPPPSTSQPLRLSVALTDAAAANEAGAPVTFTLASEGEARTLTVHRDRGFVSADLPALRERSTLTVTTTNDGQRHACFTLVAR